MMRYKQTKFIDFNVDVKSAIPVYEQIKRTIKFAILTGKLGEGDKLMSLRELSTKIQINPNTIIKVYTQLETEGYVYSRPGAGYFVKLDPTNTQKGKRAIFSEVTRDYVIRVIELGYQRDEVVTLINKLFKGENDDQD